MDRNQVMREAASRALQAVFAVRPGERLLVISDLGKRPIGEAFLGAGADLGLPGELFLLPEEDRPLRAIPDSLRVALAGRDMVVNAFGHNEDMPGGQNRSRTHRDYLVRRPTLVVEYAAGITRGLIEEGTIRL